METRDLFSGPTRPPTAELQLHYLYRSRRLAAFYCLPLTFNFYCLLFSVCFYCVYGDMVISLRQAAMTRPAPLCSRIAHIDLLDNEL